MGECGRRLLSLAQSAKMEIIYFLKNLMNKTSDFDSFAINKGKSFYEWWPLSRGGGGASAPLPLPPKRNPINAMIIELLQIILWMQILLLILQKLYL